MLSVLRLPGALRAFIPALIGRLSFAMVSLGMLLTVQQSTGSFALAGLASAISGFANVLASPWRARAIDRYGQRRALSVMAVLHVGGLLGLAAAASTAVASVWLVTLGALVGLSAPPLGASMRVIWSSLTVAGDQRRKAFSLDATCEELLFVAGPVLITAVITATSPSMGLALAAGATAIGTAGLVLSDASQRVSRSAEPSSPDERPLRQPGFARVLLALIGVGLVLGTLEVVAPAFANDRASIELSGWLLAAFAAGSAIAGLVYGHLRLRSPLPARLFTLGLGLGLTVLALAWAPSMALMAGGLALAGAFLAPSLITGYLIADDTVSPSVQTEASAWINTTVNFGASLGAGIAGVMIEGFGVASTLTAVGLVSIALASATPRRQLRGHAALLSAPAEASAARPTKDANTSSDPVDPA